MQARTIVVVDDEDHIREIAALTREAVGGWQVLTRRAGPRVAVDDPGAY